MTRFTRNTEIFELVEGIELSSFTGINFAFTSVRSLDVGSQVALRQRFGADGGPEGPTTLILESGVRTADRCLIEFVVCRARPAAQIGPRLAIALTGLGAAEVIEDLIQYGAISGSAILEACEARARSIEAKAPEAL